MPDPTPASGQEAQDVASRMFEIFECDENPMIRDLLTQVLTRALDARTHATEQAVWEEAIDLVRNIKVGNTYADEDGRIADALRRRSRTFGFRKGTP